LPAATYAGFALLHSNLEGSSDADVAGAYGKRIAFYPLSQAAKPPDTKFVDVVFDSTIPCDVRFFRALDRFVQTLRSRRQDAKGPGRRRARSPCLAGRPVRGGVRYRVGVSTAIATASV
jgi:hypothetical protein